MKLQIELTGGFSQAEAAALLTEALQRLSVAWPSALHTAEPVSFILYDDDGSTVGKVWLFPVHGSEPELARGLHNAVDIAASLLRQRDELRAALTECVMALADHVELESRRVNLPADVVCPCKSTTLAKARTALNNSKD